MPARFGRQLADHAIPVLDQARALLNQQVRTPTELGSDVSRHREHLAALIDGELGRNRRTGILRALHHQNAHADSADNAVADGEILRNRPRPQGKFRNNQSFSRQFHRQLAVFRRIDDIHAASQHGYGVPAASQRAFVGGGIDAARHPADDGETGVRQVPRQALGHCQAVGRRTPRPHYPQADGLQQLDAPAGEQQYRRIEDLAQRLRIARIADGDRHGGALRHLLVLRGGVFKGASAGDGLRHGATDAGALQFGARGAKDGLGSPKAIQQLSRSSGAQTRDEFQCQPVKFFFPAEDRRWHDARLVVLDDTSPRREYASGLVAGWYKWVCLVQVGRKNGFVWYFLVWGDEGWRRVGREGHAGSIVERGKGVVGGRAFVFNEKWRNVGVTGAHSGTCRPWPLRNCQRPRRAGF